MRKLSSLSVLLALLAVNGVQAAEEQPVPSRVVAAGLFKNGFAAVRREVKLPGPGYIR